jgi:hypothetical protein
VAAQSQYKTKKDFEFTHQDVSAVLNRRQELLNQPGVIYRCTEHPSNFHAEVAAPVEVDIVSASWTPVCYEYDAQHFANAKCSVENCEGKAWFTDWLLFEKNLLCLSHAHKQHYPSWTPKKFAEQAWKDLCIAKKHVLGNNNVSYSDLLLFFHPEMVEPSYIVLCALDGVIFDG